ncbi:MAG: GDP-mannose 4,6-dehydratase [Nitrospirota bacterium]
MRNLITGGAGFIGSHLADYLLKEGEEVVILDDLSTGSFDNIKHLVDNKRFRYYIGKVEDGRLFEGIVDSVDRIYHLAAAVGVQLIVEDPVRTIENNINSTQVVLEHAVTYGKPVLVASTSEVYGRSDKLPFSEESEVVYGPTSRFRWSYAISKAVDEFLFLAYNRQKGLPGVIVRLFNTVGPRQTGRYGMVIPRFVKQALTGEPITVYGSGEQTRCFTHVLDVVPALRNLMKTKKAQGLVVNIGNDEEITINDLAEKIQKRVNPKVEIVRLPYEKVLGKNFEDMDARRPDLTRIRQLIGYHATKTLDTIIEDVYNYYREEWKPEI